MLYWTLFTQGGLKWLSNSVGVVVAISKIVSDCLSFQCSSGRLAEDFLPLFRTAYFFTFLIWLMISEGLTGLPACITSFQPIFLCLACAVRQGGSHVEIPRRWNFFCEYS
jgi:hypothetical protein